MNDMKTIILKQIALSLLALLFFINCSDFTDITPKAKYSQ